MNQTMEQLQETKDRLVGEFERRDLQREIRDLDAMILEASLIESVGWGDVIQWNEYPEYGDYYQRSGYQMSRFEDRQDGRYKPVYESEDDVRRIRAMGRMLGPATPVSVGAVDNLYNYVFGSGFTCKFEENPSVADAPSGLVENLQRFVDQFLESNDIIGVRDRDMNTLSREDGDHFLALRDDRHIPRVVDIDPEQVLEPQNKRVLDGWQAKEYGVTDRCSWSFGVHSELRDASRVFGYHVVYSSSGKPWEYIPADRMVHIKRNVPNTAKRGISDYYPIARDLLGDDKLSRNLAKGAAAIAAIVGVRKFRPGTLKSGVTTLLDDQKSGTVARYNRDGSARNVDTIPYDEATILNTQGYEWDTGPLGASNNPNLLMVAQHIRRSIGVRWTMPEYLVSGDASNANYASTSVAAESWVKAREADQRFYGRVHKALIWKAVKIAHRNGWFPGVDWRVLRQSVIVTCEGPEVSTRDFLQVAQANSQMIADGYLSEQTAATSAGLDYDLERGQGASRREAPSLNAFGQPQLVDTNPPLTEAWDRALVAARGMVRDVR